MVSEDAAESSVTENAPASGRLVTDGERPSAERPTDESTRHEDLAPRRTLMAAERTYLAWLRTGLGALAVSVAVGRLVPALLGGSHPRLGLLGAGYGVLGVFFILYAVLRARGLDRAISANAPMRFDWWALVIITIMSLGLAVATIVMVLTEV